MIRWSEIFGSCIKILSLELDDGQIDSIRSERAHLIKIRWDLVSAQDMRLKKNVALSQVIDYGLLLK